jgi:predicted transcriptional regulator
MKRTTVFLDDAVERDVRAIAMRRGLPAASIVREALERYVSDERKEPLRLGFLAAGRSGRSDVAERHEDVVFRKLRPHGAEGSRKRPRAR